MKKLYFGLFSAFILGLSLVSCDKNSDGPDKPNPGPTTEAVDAAYILTQGTYSLKIEGTLNCIDLDATTIEEDVFVKANGRSLGATPQCGLEYDSKIYLGMYESNTIEIIDANTFKSIKQIKLDETGFDGTQPRSMAAADGKVYISMFDGYVVRLDTEKLAIDASVKVGANPEVIAIHNNKIYVPNSDGMSYPLYGTTASVISLDSFTVTSTIEVPLNPKQFLSVGGDLFLLSLGNYADIPNMLYKMNGDSKFDSIAEATYVASDGKAIYIINAPWGAVPSYSKYDVASGKSSSFTFSEVPSPNSIGVDPKSGSIIISSYKDTGWESYTVPGFVYQYDSTGKFIKKYDSGVGPACIFFNNH